MQTVVKQYVRSVWHKYRGAEEETRLLPSSVFLLLTFSSVSFKVCVQVTSDPKVHEIAYKYGENVGIAFQVISILQKIALFKHASCLHVKCFCRSLSVRLAAGGRRVGLHIRSQSPGEALGCGPQTGPGHWAGPLRLSTGERDETFKSLGYTLTHTHHLLISLSSHFFQFPELHSLIMRRFSSEGDIDRAWQYVLQVRPTARCEK